MSKKEEGTLLLKPQKQADKIPAICLRLWTVRAVVDFGSKNKME